MSLIERAVKSKQQGDWQDLFGEILGPADESG
jgi:hypothetical protein